jgi:hypothetical protein
MTALLYRWPVAAKFGRVVPKTKFYENTTVLTPVKDKFVSDVQRITWAYKLAESTINLTGNASVPEIQIFEIDAKTDEISESVLATIDKAVKTPVVFEINRDDGSDRATQMVAAHKQLGSGAPKLGPYYSTDWQPADTNRDALPTAIDLTGLYTALLQPLTQIATRPGEEVSEVVARLGAVRALEREILALERKIRTEPQLNRKIELRRTLKTRQTTLVDLTSQTPNPVPGNSN